MKKNIRNYIVSIVALTALTIGGSLSVFASNPTTAITTQSSSSATTSNSTSVGHQGGMRHAPDFSNFVTSGTINQATADKITTYIQNNKPTTPTDGTSHPDMFADLVKANIITQVQADTMKAAMPAGGHQGGMRHAPDFSTLVTSGTINQATADKIITYIQNNKPTTPTDGTSHPDMFADLVKANIITQTQADAMKAAMPAGGHQDGMRHAPDFSTFVTSGTINQATADKITTYIQNNKPTTPTDGTSHPDMFADLVKANIITQAQADAIKAAMPTGGHQGGMRHAPDFSTFVTSGTINQATADKIITYIQNNKPTTPTDGTSHPDMFADLVKANIITQTQADAMKAAMPAPPTNKNLQSTTNTINSTSSASVKN